MTLTFETHTPLANHLNKLPSYFMSMHKTLTPPIDLRERDSVYYPKTRQRMQFLIPTSWQVCPPCSCFSDFLTNTEAQTCIFSKGIHLTWITQGSGSLTTQRIWELSIPKLPKKAHDFTHQGALNKVRRCHRMHQRTKALEGQLTFSVRELRQVLSPV